MKGITDAGLVAASLSGDRKAFGELIHRYIRLVVAVAQASVGAQEAEDLAQDVFSEAWRSLKGLRAPENFKAWLVGITRHLCIYRLRRRSREEEVYSDLSEIQRMQKEESRTQDARAAHAENIDMLKAAVDTMPETYKQVVLMRYMAGMSVEEIADSLGISRAACDKRLTRAKQRLKDTLRNVII